MESRFSIKRLAGSIRLFITGFTMGAADLVPGVSGGTVAFIFGIYEQLIHSIKTLSGDVVKLALKGQFVAAFKKIPFTFLVPLGLGLLTAVVSLANILTYLLATYPVFVWAFFFGLVIASIFLVRKRVVTWNTHDVLALVVTAIAAYFIVGAVPVETPNTLPALFFAGAIAICAMILPGVSGSFLLLIMGKYEQVLSAVANRDIVSIAVFGMGAVVGLAVFSRVLSWLFQHHHDLIVSMLIGFMIGSLRKIWPWKEVLETRLNSHGELVPLIERNIFPPSLDSSFVIAIVCGLVGFGLIVLLESLQSTKEHTKDVNDPQFSSDHARALRSQKSGKL